MPRKTKTLTPEQVRAHLDGLEDHYLIGKPGTSQRVIHSILGAIIQARGARLWPDQVDFDWVPVKERNIIGPMWRHLMDLGIIEQTGEHKVSAKDWSRGRQIWEYQVIHMRAAIRCWKLNKPISVSQMYVQNT